MPNKYIVLAKDRDSHWWNFKIVWGELNAIRARQEAMSTDDIIQARYELL